MNFYIGFVLPQCPAPWVCTLWLGAGVTRGPGYTRGPGMPGIPGTGVPGISGIRGIPRTPACPGYGFIGFGDIHDPKPYEFIGFGDIHGPKPCGFIRFGDLKGGGSPAGGAASSGPAMCWIALSTARKHAELFRWPQTI